MRLSKLRGTFRSHPSSPSLTRDTHNDPVLGFAIVTACCSLLANVLKKNREAMFVWFHAGSQNSIYYVITKLLRACKKGKERFRSTVYAIEVNRAERYSKALEKGFDNLNNLLRCP